MGQMSVSLRARRDPLIIAIAHSDVIGLAALISQAGEGSREEVVARQRSSTLSTINRLERVWNVCFLISFCLF